MWWSSLFENMRPSDFFNFSFFPKYGTAFVRGIEYTLLLAVVSVLLAVVPALLLALMLQYTLPAPFIIPLFADLGDDAEYVSTTLSLGTVLAVSDHEGNVRGYVANPQADLPLRDDGKLDVGGAVGAEGTITVIKDLHMKEPYVGTVDLLGGEIAEDITSYFAESEQIPTACALGVLVDRDQSVKAAGGYLIQLMPGAGEDTIAKVEGGVMAAGPVSAILEQSDDPEALLRTVMSDFDLKILETCPVSYKCYCSRQRVERALISLGKPELEQMLAEQGGCQLTCQFCDAVYDFSADDLRALIAGL